MKVTNFKVKQLKKNTVFSADFSFNNKNLNQTIWFKIPTVYCSNVNPANAFLVAAVPLALALNEDLRFEGKVSEKLYKNMFKLNRCLGLASRQIKIEVDDTSATNQSSKKNGRNGLFFSLGADSFYSLFIENKKLRRKNKIQYLIFVDGIETFPVSEKLRQKIFTNLKKISKRYKKDLIVISTNNRQLSDKIVNWNHYHGAGIATGALLLDNFLNKIYISSSDEYFFKIYYGTGIEIDKLWSTENLVFQSLSIKLTKIDKLIQLAKYKESAFVAKNIWVCWQKTTDNRFYNCMRCEKCMRTFLGLLSGGINPKIINLDKNTVNLLKQIKISEARLHSWQTIKRLLATNKVVDDKIVGAVKQMLQRQKIRLFLDKISPQTVKTKIKKILLKAYFMLKYSL